MARWVGGCRPYEGWTRAQELSARQLPCNSSSKKRRTWGRWSTLKWTISSISRPSSASASTSMRKRSLLCITSHRCSSWMNFKSPTSLPQDVRFIGLPGSAIDLVSGSKMFEGYSHFSIFIVTVYNFSQIKLGWFMRGFHPDSFHLLQAWWPPNDQRLGVRNTFQAEPPSSDTIGWGSQVVLGEATELHSVLMPCQLRWSHLKPLRPLVHWWTFKSERIALMSSLKSSDHLRWSKHAEDLRLFIRTSSPAISAIVNTGASSVRNVLLSSASCFSETVYVCITVCITVFCSFQIAFLWGDCWELHCCWIKTPVRWIHPPADRWLQMCWIWIPHHMHLTTPAAIIVEVGLSGAAAVRGNLWRRPLWEEILAEDLSTPLGATQPQQKGYQSRQSHQIAQAKEALWMWLGLLGLESQTKPTEELTGLTRFCWWIIFSILSDAP